MTGETGGALERPPAGTGRVRLAPWPRGDGRGTADRTTGVGAATACAPRPPWRDSAFQLLLLAALWVAARPYRGIIQDAQLYTVQALKALQPERLATDLWFAFGSQDTFTVFSALYPPLVNALGPAAAHRFAAVFGQACWLVALLFFTRSMFAGHAAILAAAAVVTLNPYYGGFFIFSYGEAFTTPRIFAEAGVLAALALVLRGRVASGACCALAATSVHALMALPGIGVLCVLLALRDRRFLLLYAALAVAGAALAATGVQPFARAFMVFDDAWFAILLERNANAFLSRWGWSDFLGIVPAGSVFAVAWHLASAAERRLLLAVAAVAAGGLAVTFVGADAARNVLAANLQTWRALWLPALVANAWASVVASRLPAAADSRRFLLVAMACAAAEQWARIPAILSSVAFGLAMLAFLGERRARQALAWPYRLAGWAVAASVVAFLLPLLWGALTATAESGRDAAPATLGVTAVVLSGAVTALVLAPRLSWKPSLAAWSVGFALLAAAAAVSDRRTGWQAFIEREEVPEELRAFAADAGNLYWEAGLSMAWLKLRRPSHYSCHQSAGAMLFAGAAREHQRRTDGLSGLNTGDFENQEGKLCALKREPGELGPANKAQLEAACRALPELDTLVLAKRVEGVRSASWQAPVPLLIRRGRDVPTRHDTFHKYRCSDLR